MLEQQRLRQLDVVEQRADALGPVRRAGVVVAAFDVLAKLGELALCQDDAAWWAVAPTIAFEVKAVRAARALAVSAVLAALTLRARERRPRAPVRIGQLGHLLGEFVAHAAAFGFDAFAFFFFERFDGSS